MDAQIIDLAQSTPLGLSLGATLAGALQGALLALDDENADLVGMAVLGLCLGFGGGIVRDVLVGHLPPVALRSPWYLVTVIVAVLIVALFGRRVVRFEAVLLVVDAATLGLFAIIGTQTALNAQLSLLTAIFVGSFASVGSGVIADVLRGHRPMVLRPGPPYALVAVAGSLTFGAMVDLGVNGGIASLAAIATTFTARLVTFKAGVSTRPAGGLRSPNERPPPGDPTEA